MQCGPSSTAEIWNLVSAMMEISGNSYDHQSCLGNNPESVSIKEKGATIWIYHARNGKLNRMLSSGHICMQEVDG